MKRIAILQSNYVPWKGYFDLIAAVDEFVLYDVVQYTRSDWRNRNRIKTPKGAQWLSIPVGGDLDRRICDVPLPASRWAEQHWRTLALNYGRAPHFAAVASWLEPIYRQPLVGGSLSAFNRQLIEAICVYLGIRTKISDARDFQMAEGKSNRLVGICRQAGASAYVSGLAAKAYLDEALFAQNQLTVQWFDYGGYPSYPQLWGEFMHEVTVLDLLFNCGPQAPQYMKFGREPGTGGKNSA